MTQVITRAVYKWRNGQEYEQDFAYESGHVHEKMVKILNEEEHLITLSVKHPTIKGLYIKLEKNEA